MTVDDARRVLEEYLAGHITPAEVPGVLYRACEDLDGSAPVIVNAIRGALLVPRFTYARRSKRFGPMPSLLSEVLAYLHHMPVDGDDVGWTQTIKLGSWCCGSSTTTPEEDAAEDMRQTALCRRGVAVLRRVFEPEVTSYATHMAELYATLVVTETKGRFWAAWPDTQHAGAGSTREEALRALRGCYTNWDWRRPSTLETVEDDAMRELILHGLTPDTENEP